MRHDNRNVASLVVENADVSSFIEMLDTHDENVYEGRIRKIQLSPGDGKGVEIIKPIHESKGLEVSFRFHPIENKLILNLKQARITFLNWFIDEIIGFLEVISVIFKNNHESNADKKESKFDFVLEMETNELLLPKSSNNDNFLLINFSKAMIRQIEEKKEFVLSKSKKISKIYPSSYVNIDFYNANALVKIDEVLFPFASSKHAELKIYVPKLEDIQGGKRIHMLLSVFETDFKISIARMIQMTEILKSNLDEKSAYFQKAASSKNVKFKFKVKSGKLKMMRWLTAEQAVIPKIEKLEFSESHDSKLQISDYDVPNEISDNDEEPKFTP